MTSQELTHGRPQGVTPVTIENARIFFRNFEGREGQYNEQGVRSFGVALPDDFAEIMARDGWNVKQLRPREEGDAPQSWVPVSVNFGKGRPPRVVLIVDRYNHEIGDFQQVRTTLGEDEVGVLDFADMANVDLILNPYPYNVNGRAGIKAYLKSIYVTMRLDALEAKYAAVPEIEMDGELLQLEAGPGDGEEIIEGELMEDD